MLSFIQKATFEAWVVVFYQFDDQISVMWPLLKLLLAGYHGYLLVLSLIAKGSYHQFS